MKLARMRFMLAPALLVLMLAYQGVFAVQVMVSDVLNFNVQRLMVFWEVDGNKPAAGEVAAALEQMQWAVKLWPHHPDYLALQARLQWWQGQIAPGRQTANANYKFAIATMHESLVARPGNPYSWSQYASYLATQRDKKIELLLVVDKVGRLAAGNKDLQKQMQALVQN